MNNPAVAALPKHLLQFAVDQRYDDYTPVDHAVWRFIMRQNIFFLKAYAHTVYFQDLIEPGISFQLFPRIQEINDISDRIARGAARGGAISRLSLSSAHRSGLPPRRPGSGWRLRRARG